MIDFSKLNDPVEREKTRKAREAESQRLEAIEAEQHAAIQLCVQHEDTLTAKERQFVRSVQFALLRFSVLSPAQDKWLRDIAARLKKS